MAYQVIARKWRPQKFEEITGQEILTRTLQNSISANRLHHAYLFCGTRGVGKTTTARLLAKALNCHKSKLPTISPCVGNESCSSCEEITQGRSIDVLEIDAASNTGIESIRDIITNSIGIAPARDRYKIFIIDEVHALSASAFNALLKTLEEPPSRVFFILATTEKHKVPETILSRSQVFTFRSISTVKIAERLKLIADAEKIDIDNEALLEIARCGEGSMRDAQSALDQVINYSGEKITSQEVEQALGLVGSDMLERVMASIKNNQPSEAFAIVEEIVSRGYDLRMFCQSVLGHIRNLTILNSTSDISLIESGTNVERLTEQAKAFSHHDLVRFFHSFAETESSLKTATNPKYIVEIGLVKIIEMPHLAPIAELLSKFKDLEKKFEAKA